MLIDSNIFTAGQRFQKNTRNFPNFQVVALIAGKLVETGDSYQQYLCELNLSPYIITDLILVLKKSFFDQIYCQLTSSLFFRV